jgi:hypothetical protein
MYRLIECRRRYDNELSAEKRLHSRTNAPGLCQHLVPGAGARAQGNSDPIPGSDCNH